MDRDTTVWYRRPQYLVIAVLTITYVAILGRYRAYDLDNSWYLSFSYGQVVRHIPTGALGTNAAKASPPTAPAACFTKIRRVDSMVDLPDEVTSGPSVLDTARQWYSPACIDATISTRDKNVPLWEITRSISLRHQNHVYKPNLRINF